MKNKTLGVLGAAAISMLGVATPAAAQARCGIEGEGEVNVITNFFPALEVVAKAMEACEDGGLTVDVKLTTEHKAETDQAFAAASSPYDAAAVANSSITLLQSRGQLLPLNDLVEKYRDSGQIEDQMLIRFGDDIMALAFMVNAQHLFYRKDIFAELGLEPPKTYAELIETAAKIEAAGTVEHAFGAAYGNSWELGNEYVNLLLANGGALFDPMTSEPTFESPEAVAALETMGGLFAHMSPNALSMDFGDVKRQLQQGQVAMAILWGDQAPTMDDDSESSVAGKVGFAVAPAMQDGGAPASTFWWDGFVIPKNLDGDPDLTFQVLLEGLKPEVVEENNDVALWLRSNYKPNAYTGAITETVMAGAAPYPMNPQSALAHNAIGENITDFLTGRESAEKALADAARAYRAAARDQGIIGN